MQQEIASVMNYILSPEKDYFIINQLKNSYLSGLSLTEQLISFGHLSKEDLARIKIEENFCTMNSRHYLIIWKRKLLLLWKRLLYLMKHIYMISGKKHLTGSKLNLKEQSH